MLCRGPGTAIEFPHFQLGEPQRQSPLPYTCQLLTLLALALPPLSLPSGDPPLLSFGFIGHLRGQLRGRWEGTVCPHKGTVGGLSACWAQLILLQEGTLSNGNKLPLCWSPPSAGSGSGRDLLGGSEPPGPVLAAQASGLHVLLK